MISIFLSLRLGMVWAAVYLFYSQFTKTSFQSSFKFKTLVPAVQEGVHFLCIAFNSAAIDLLFLLLTLQRQMNLLKTYTGITDNTY